MYGVFHIDGAIGFAVILAIILLATKLCGLLFRKFGLPQVLGYIVAGLLVGPAIFGELCGASLIGFTSPDRNATYKCLFLLSGEGFDLGTNGLAIFSKIGVLLLLFSTGLETDLKELRKTGLAATLIACAGVAVPMVLGILICLPFGSIDGLELGPNHIYNCIFIGAILTATSVAITVSVLKELGKISTKLGTTIVSAAIIDDVIGIIVLSVVVGIANAGNADASVGGFEGFKSTIYGTIIMIVAFFIVAIALGFGLSKLFRWLEKKWPNTRRLSVFSLAMCFFYAWIAEEIFGVADITGAFLAGVILSTAHNTREYTDKKVEVNTYTFFAPVFFANIGISNISFLGMSGWLVLVAFLAVLMGLIGKVVGCGAVAKGFKYSWRESGIAGVGMMARGEVALIVTSVAVGAGLPQQYMLMTVLLILVSSILTPILLKVLYKEKKPPEGGEGVPVEGETLKESAEPAAVGEAPAQPNE